MNHDLAHIVEQIKNRISIADVLQPTVQLKRLNNRNVALCPFHKEKSPSFNVDIDKGTYHCFGCGKHGDHFTFLTEHQGMTFHEALLQLAERANITLPKNDYKKKTNNTSDANEMDMSPSSNQTQKLLEIMNEASLWYERKLDTPSAQSVRNYLSKRLVPPEMISKFRLGFSPARDSLKDYLIEKGYTLTQLKEAGLLNDKQSDRFKGRLMFPIWDSKGRVIAFGGRALEQDQIPKYLNSSDTPLFHKSFILYAQHLSFTNVNKDTPPLIVEGYLDVITMHQYGFNTALATLGTAFSDHHMKRLWQRHPTPLFCFDGDSAGRNAAFRVSQKIFPLLKPGFTACFCFLPEGEDPDTYLKKNDSKTLKNIINNPQSLLDTLWNGYKTKFDIGLSSTPETKTQFKKAIMDHIQLIQDPDLKQFFKDDLKNRLYNIFNPFTQKAPQKTNVQKNIYSTSNITPFNTQVITNKLVDAKKNHSAAKILLLILKNNPILINRVFEMLMQMNDLTKDFILFRDFLCENHHLNTEEIERKAYECGMKDILNQLSVLNLQGLPTFVSPQTDVELALIGWKDLWYQHYIKKQLGLDGSRIKNQLLENLNEENWEQWQQHKIMTAQTIDK